MDEQDKAALRWLGRFLWAFGACLLALVIIGLVWLVHVVWRSW